MTDTLPTVKELLADHELLLRTAAEVLCEKPWHHTLIRGRTVFVKCPRCGQDAKDGECPVPPAIVRDDYQADASDADIAERLVKKCLQEKVFFAAIVVLEILSPAPHTTIERWVRATLAEHIACCLVALQKAKVE